MMIGCLQALRYYSLVPNKWDGVGINGGGGGGKIFKQIVGGWNKPGKGDGKSKNNFSLYLSHYGHDYNTTKV